MKLLSLIFISLLLANCTFEEEDSLDEGAIEGYDRVQRERASRVPERVSPSEEDDEDLEVEKFEEFVSEVVGEVDDEGAENLQAEELQANVEIPPPISPPVETTLQEQIPNQPVDVLSSEPVNVAGNVQVAELTQQAVEEPQLQAEPQMELQAAGEPQVVIEPSVLGDASENVSRGVYISNTTDLPIFYVDKVSNERSPIPPNECFVKVYPNQTGLSRLYFAIIANRDGTDEIVCDNCMVNETTVSTYFSVGISNIYSVIQIFNQAPINIEPGTVIYNQSESIVKQQCELN